jgi:hypothetical protein
LAIEDEERGDVMSLPLVQFILEAPLDPSQTAEGREEGLVARENIEMQLEVVCGVNGDRAVFDFVQGMGPRVGGQRDPMRGGTEGELG